MKNEIVIHRGHRVTYDRCYQLTGATLVEIGRSKGTEEWELEAAIIDRTAAAAYVFGPPPCGAVSFERTVEIAHDRGVPVIVDAAAMLPPVENLTRYLHLGTDMVSFSGGKGTRGPQSTGILAGRNDLIEAARLNAAPNRYGLGRMAKAFKGEIAGLVTALKLFLDTDQDAVMAEWRRKCMHIVEGLRDIPEVRAEVIPARPTVDDAYNTSDRAAIHFDEDYSGPSLEEIYSSLEASDPSIRVRDGGVLGGIGVYPPTSWRAMRPSWLIA